MTPDQENQLLAAIDLGSNSFHLAIAKTEGDEVRKLSSVSEKVQLAGGLDENNVLSDVAMTRGLDCLKRFVSRLHDIPPGRIRVVATNALRQAVNAQEFIDQANAFLPKPIEVIAGREEARLIYLGVSLTLADQRKRLVVDIGGGSTEFIIGEKFEPLVTESLQLGCVAYTKAFFPTGQISPKAFDKAYQAACKEVSLIREPYREIGWNSVVGSSGTIKAARAILQACNLTNEQGEITKSGLEKIKSILLSKKSVDELDFLGLKEDRKAVLPAGLAILLAIFDMLEIKSMAYSDGALREGVMYDLLGRFKHEDIRDRSIQGLLNRYDADPRQARRVTATAQNLFNQLKDPLNLSDEEGALLNWAALTHEIGLAVSHGGYHRHGAYLLEHSDIPGFSHIDQSKLSQIVASHRRKLRPEQLFAVKSIGGKNLIALVLILRLAVLLHQSRSSAPLPDVKVSINGSQCWKFTVPSALADNGSIYMDLYEEAEQFKNWGYQLLLETNVTSS